jgi:hypothetical protein
VIRIVDALDTDPDTVPAAAPLWQGLATVKLPEIELMIGRLSHLRDLLRDAVALGYLPADRAHLAPAALGWIAPEAQQDAGPGPALRTSPTATR